MMARRNSYILVTFLIVLICMIATIAQGQNNNGNGNTGNNNGNNNAGSNNGNKNTGNNNGNNNSGNNNGNANTGNNNGNANTGNNNGNANTGNNNGNNNSGNNNGNSNTGSNNGNNNSGNNNGNANTGNNNGNNNSGNNNGNANTGNNNGNNNSGNNNGNANTGNNNGNGNSGSNNGNGNSGSNNGNGNSGNNNGNGNSGNNNGNGNAGNNNGNGNAGNNNGNGNTGSSNGNGNAGSSNGNGNSGSSNGTGNNGTSNGTGNSGTNNGNGNNGTNNGNNNTDNNNGNGNNGSGKGNNNGASDPEATNYDMLTPLGTGRERAFCKSKACHYQTLVCPAECPERKPKQNKKKKGCFINCGGKCEATCKFRKPKCDGYGSLCYDPRFVGGDGVMFYFHGAKGGNFAIVSDENLQINAHFIGTRPAGRTRDYTWVQALAIMFDSHSLVIAANKVTHWDDNVDALLVRWDGEAVEVPTDGEAEWRTNGKTREVIVERTDDANSVRVSVAGLVEINVKVRPIGKEENKVHNYQLPYGDAFAHLETQFTFSGLSDLVEGVLGKTYRPDYVSSVKRGVPMPMMGGEDKYQTPSLYSSLCKLCRFQRQPEIASI